MELIIFVGLQGAGKSTFYRERLAATRLLVSKDLFGNRPHKQRRQMLQIEEALAAGRSVVVDNTNVTHDDRAPLIAAAKAHGAHVVGYFFTTPLALCLQRNAAREGPSRVPTIAIFAARKRLQPPTLAEGFDALYTVAPEGERGWRITRSASSPPDA